MSERCAMSGELAPLDTKVYRRPGKDRASGNTMIQTESWRANCPGCGRDVGLRQSSEHDATVWRFPWRFWRHNAPKEDS